MAIRAHIAIKGKKLGQFKGEGAQDERQDKWIPVLGFFMSLKSPRDGATGQASGKRQFKPVTIVKAWGAASPQGLTACSTNEVLSEVSIEFQKTNANGEEYVYQTVKLTDATLVEATRFEGDLQPSEGAATWRFPAREDSAGLEEWVFTFRKIEVEDKDGKTSYSDEWGAIA
jgi:type VI secretion system secreted protein Hcp